MTTIDRTPVHTINRRTARRAGAAFTSGLAIAGAASVTVSLMVSMAKNSTIGLRTR